MSETKSYTTGQTWGALRRSWKGYRIAKGSEHLEDMKKYAKQIQSLEKELNVKVSEFPRLDL